MNSFLSHYDAPNLIGYIALFLAYLAYRKSLLDDIKNWQALLMAFNSELSYASYWIGNSYTISDPLWSNPSKVVYPLTFESAKAIISKGHPPQKLIPKEFLDNLAIFNERIVSFNHFLNAQLENYVYNDINAQQTKDKALYLNDIIHKNMIGNKKSGELFSLYYYFDKKIAVINEAWENKIPLYLKYPWLILITSFFIYLLIDYWL